MFSFALAAATEAAEEHRELPMEPWVFGVLALAGFFALFLLTWSFRGVANRLGARPGSGPHAGHH